MKYFSVFFLSIITFIGHSQINGQIQWSPDQNIDWSNFSGSVQHGSKHHALTASGVSINMRQDIPDTVTITVLANFHPDKSWLKEGKETAHLLNHEQRHFDIAEIFRRKLMKKLLTSDALKTSNINERVDKLYVRNDKEMLEYQLAYDKATHHSQEEDQQVIWNKKIATELKDLEDYAHSEIKIPVAQILQRTTKRKSSKRRRK